ASPMNSVARGAAVRRAMFDNSGKYYTIQLIGDRLFESIFVFQEGSGLTRIISKDESINSSGHVPLTWNTYISKARISLYAGFSMDSPSLSLHKEFEVDLGPGRFKEKNEPIYLWWSIDQNRTITYQWSETLDENDRRPLKMVRELSAASRSSQEFERAQKRL